MNLFLIIAFLFCIGSFAGWCLELVYRRFFSSANPEKKWINPGFLIGPYLPLYGFSLCVVFILAQINLSFIKNVVLQKLILFVVMALVVTLIEYVTGLIFIKGMKVKLWDYEKEWGNVKGIICPKYSFYWAVLSAIYYFLIHPHIIKSLQWLANHLAFSFVVGFFYGIFMVDLCYSMKIITRIRRFANENDIIVKTEALKESIRKKNAELREKRKFMFVFHSEKSSLAENLKNYIEKEQEKVKENKKNLIDKINHSKKKK